MDISANGQRARLSRDVGTVVMDLNGVEHIQVNALGGADTITVNDLTGTDVTRVALDLSAPTGSGQGDGQPDTVIVNGTAGDDHINVASSGASVVINGLAAKVTLAGAEGGKDSLVVNGLAGNDTINASALNPGQINLTINGGAGNDTITGSRGNDVVIGGTGNDVALLGAGDDTFIWNPGDGSDTVEGQSGTDTLRFNGANIGETIDISANGSRARLSRNVGNVTMDLDGVEHIEVNALGGADTITVTNNNGVITVSGLPEAVTISNFEAANDRIVINGLGGDDVITASGLTGILFTANGGDGNDVLIGGGGQDVLDGGPGNNTVIASATVAALTNTGGGAAVSDGSGAAGVALLGQFAASSFVAAGDAHGTTQIADQPSNQQPLLTQPHA